MPQGTPNPALKQLHALVGEWTIENPQFPGVPGQTTFEWLEGGFLVQRTEVEHPAAPNSTWIIGRDDSTETYCMLYHDERGVSRVYQMSLADGVWTVWRHAPGFSQRFIGTFTDDGGVIKGRWEKSGDGSNWEHDFDLVYTRIR